MFTNTYVHAFMHTYMRAHAVNQKGRYKHTQLSSIETTTWEKTKSKQFLKMTT